MNTTVLIVEDFEPFRRVLHDMLQNMPDLRVIGEVGDGVQAVQKSAELRPDLILLDIGLPRLNGIEAARQIKNLFPESTIIFVSQETSAEIVQEVLALGAQGYVMKADAGRELLTAISSVLRGEQFLSSTISSPNVLTRVPKVPAELSQSLLATPSRHEVQFYSDDASFASTAADFLGPAIKAGDSAVVLLTRPRREALLKQMQTYGFDLSALSQQGRYISLDASEFLSMFMTNDLPDRDRFMKIASDLLNMAAKPLAADHNCIAVCGSCAPLLWSQGNARGAIRLEQLWNELGEQPKMHTLCAYAMDSFQGELGADVFDKICAEHSAVYAR